MKAYLVETQGNLVVVRAESSEIAQILLPSAAILTELRSDVATAMKVPNAKGIYENALWDWIEKPANMLGETISN